MSKKNKISIVYDRLKDSRTYAVSGIIGGLSPAKPHSVVCHLFMDYNSIPTVSEVEINEDGKIDNDKPDNISRGDIIREVISSMSMSAETAISIGKWLKEKGEEAKKLNK